MDVLMPQLGETVEEGKIIAWYKAVGDCVAVGDNLFEIETEKVSMEVPAISAGVLTEIRVGVEESAPVGAVVAVIRDSASTAATPKAAAVAQLESPRAISAAPMAASAIAAGGAKPERSPAIAPSRTRKLDAFREVLTPERNYGPVRIGTGVATTPLARRMAAEIGVDLSSAQGSGPDGLIRARDVEALRASAARARRSEPSRPSPPPGVPSADQVKALYAPGSYMEQPIDGMRRVIARRLTQSKQTVPHFYMTVDLELDALARLREEINAAASQQHGKPAFKLSINDLLIKAWASALLRVPAANTVWAEDCILRFTHADIGVAVAVEGGLFTPVIRRADTKTPGAISIEMKDLVSRARARKLRPEDLQGGASAISNLGMHGVREFTAIINPPQSTILAVGAVERRAVEAQRGGVRFASLMTVTLSCDHRVVDGSLGAEVLSALRELIRKPDETLVAGD